MYKFVLFVHVFSLIVAYGSVLFVDFYGLFWVLGKKTKTQMLEVSKAAQILIWSGLVGLILSGKFLHPNFTKPLTQLKMLLVLIIICNGINLHFVQKAMKSEKLENFWQLPKKLIVWSIVSITLSQLAWLGACIIGFINTSSHLVK
ncbi:MAG: hypothetical protein U0516_04750 [Candidatus Saccharibacteria bacterium]